MSLGSLLSLAALGVSGFLGVYILAINPRRSANRAFFVLMLAFVIWDVSEAIMRAFPPGTPAETILPWVRGVWMGICLVPAALTHLALVYPTASPWMRHRGALAAVYAPYAAWAYIVLFTNWIFDGVTTNTFGWSADSAPTYLYLAIPFGSWLYLSVGLFLRAWWRVRRGTAGKMQGVVTVGLLLASVPAGVTEAFWPALGWDTVFGLGSLYTLAWSVIIAFAVARYEYLVVEIEPVTEIHPPRAMKHGFDPGLNYLVVEGGRSTAMGAFREIVTATPGLCVTGLHPARVEKRFGLERTPVLWITTTSAVERSVRPTGLDFELLHSVIKFLRENRNTAVLLDDLDYLAAVNGFEAVARFVKRVANQASASGGTLIVAAGQGTFTRDQIAVLRGAVDHVLEVLHGPADLSIPNGDHVLLLVTAQDGPSALVAAGAQGGLLMTTEHPVKARRRYGDAFQILAVSEGSEANVPSVRPHSLDAEVKRAVASFIASHRGADVAILGLEQLALFNDFRTILTFLKDTMDLASLGGCRLFVTMSPEAFPSREAAMLARRFDAPTGQAVIRNSLPSAPTTAVPGSRILY